jgi:type II secretory pathway component PulJ
MALRALAGALIANGHPVRNPFAAFRGRSASKLERMAFTKKVDAVRALVAAVRQDEQLGARAVRAARLVDAARAVERAIVHLNNVETEARDARTKRDAIGRGWHDAYAVLKYSARAAAAEGAPELHERLFPAARVAAKRRRRAVSTPTTPTQQSGSVGT